MPRRDEVNAPLLREYLYKLYIDKDKKRISRKIGIPSDYLEKIVRCEVLPQKYELLEDVITIGGGKLSDLREISRKEPQLLYTYWADIFPDGQSISKIGFILKDIIIERDIDRREVLKKIECTQAYLSAIENCRTPLTYTKMCIIADAIGSSPEEVLERFSRYEDVEKNRNMFINMIIEARRKNGWDIGEASLHLKISELKLARIEEGKAKVTPNNLTNMVEVYELNYSKALEYVYHGRYLTKIYPSIKDYYKKPKNVEEKRVLKENYLEDYLYYLCGHYKEVVGGEGIRKVHIETHTLATLVFMILTNQFRSKEKYRYEILYYLNNISKEGVLAYDLLANSKIKVEESGIGKVFNAYREAYRFSYMDLERYTGYAKGFINNRVHANDFVAVKFCDRVLPAVGLPVSIGYESLCITRAPLVLNSEELKEKLSLVALVEEMETSLLWSFRYENIPIELIRRMFAIIFDKDDGFSKYERLKTLSFPDRYSTTNKEEEKKAKALSAIY